MGSSVAQSHDGAKPKPKPRLTALEAAACGSFSGIMSRLVISPLDVVKIRLQLQVEPLRQKTSGTASHHVRPVGHYRGWTHAMSLIIREEGAQALFKGNLTADLLYVCYGAVQFGLYNEWKAHIGQNTPTMALVGGGLAGTVATITTYPLDILRTRMAAQGEPRVYPTLRSAIVRMYRTEGPRGFFKGLVPTLMQILPYMSIQFYLYETTTRMVKKAVAYRKKKDWREVKLNPVQVLLDGAFSGALSKLIVMPFDTVRKRLQVQGFEAARIAFGRVDTYKGFTHCVQTILRKEGFTGFYKGGTPALMKALLSSAVTWVSYEKSADMIAYWRDRDNRRRANRF